MRREEGGGRRRRRRSKRRKETTEVNSDTLKKLILKVLRIYLYIKINDGEPQKTDSQVRSMFQK